MKKKIRKLVLAAAFCGFLAFFLPIAGAALSRKPSLDSEAHSINTTGQINRPESSMSISESPSGPDIEAEEVDLDRIESVSETDTEKTEETVVPSAPTGDDASVLFFGLFFISGVCLIVLKKAKRGFFYG